MEREGERSCKMLRRAGGREVRGETERKRDTPPRVKQNESKENVAVRMFF
jgi:hypothetical protein